MPRHRRDWSLTAERLDRLLRRLGPDPESAGERYNRLHARLVMYFENNACSDPYEYADRTIDRLATKLDEQPVPESEIEYFTIGLARKIRLENARQAMRMLTIIRRLMDPIALVDHLCLEESFRKLDDTDRMFIECYYPDAVPKDGLAEHRKRLAALQGVNYDNLRARASKVARNMARFYAECRARRIF